MKYFTRVFDKNEIPFWQAEDKSFVGAKSFVGQFGVDWSSQCAKIKKMFNYGVFPIEHNGNPSIQALGINKIHVADYLSTINPFRAPVQYRDTIRKYQTHFPAFVEDQTKQIDGDLFGIYIKDQAGFSKLVNDILISKPSKAVTKLSKILFAISSPESFDGDRYDVIDTLLDLVEDMADSSIQNQIKKLVSIA